MYTIQFRRLDSFMGLSNTTGCTHYYHLLQYLLPVTYADRVYWLVVGESIVMREQFIHCDMWISSDNMNKIVMNSLLILVFSTLYFWLAVILTDKLNLDVALVHLKNCLHSKWNIITTIHFHFFSCNYWVSTITIYWCWRNRINSRILCDIWTAEQINSHRFYNWEQYCQR